MSSLTAFLLGSLGALALVWAVVWARGRFASFAAQSPQDYAKGPAFDLTRHLSGPLAMEGIIYGPTGRVASRFVATAEGRWQNGQGVLAETFRYDSGAVQDRAWNLSVTPDGRITGTAADIVGQATGQVQGSAVVMRYRIRLAPQAGGHVLSVTDWMYLLDNGSVMNRSEFRKVGLKVAELVATIRPLPAAAQDAGSMAAE